MSAPTARAPTARAPIIRARPPAIRAIDPPQLHAAAARLAPFVCAGIIDFSEALAAVMALGIENHWPAIAPDIDGIQNRLSRTISTTIQTHEIEASTAIRTVVRNLIGRRAHRMVILEFAHAENRGRLKPTEVAMIAREEVSAALSRMKERRRA